MKDEEIQTKKYRIYTNNGIITENNTIEEIQNLLLELTWEEEKDYFEDLTDEQAEDKEILLEIIYKWIEEGDECHSSCK